MNVSSVSNLSIVSASFFYLCVYFFGRHLHAEISEHPELVETFAFVDPASSFFVNSEFEDYILNRFREGNPDRLFFLPHNKK